ncbi:L-2-amino-thiazoline-4-carboxylic acid hydrolase [Solimonas sp. K1W22B-7]|uniref:L-2-amino-thiazoline-4-carboxylic acid hydrolase n=1 Tax=Solimonas sp. K1W22B-7 TaxID=2303331 RepID=UPI0013C47C96|nr:L-2-amino-thiazoline-4-carboxylic acid hydrolase [Solimonas sp. K1W22B-7]
MIDEKGGVGSLLWRAKGDPSRRWLVFCWSVLFAYRALRPFLGQKKAIAVLQTALSRQFKRQRQAYMNARFGITQERPEEAFERISQNYKARGESLFGPRFTYVQAIQDQRRSHTHITRCLFNDFFRTHGAPEVTSLFCALDTVWADELNQPRYKAHFERPTTLAAGDDACRFQFSRAEGEAQAPLQADTVAKRQPGLS